MAPHRNTLLHSLSPADARLVEPHLKPTKFEHGDVLGDTGAPILHAYFPETGLISIIVELATGDRIEAAVVGRTGMLGAACAFGGKSHLNTAIVRMPGGGQMMAAEELISAADKSETLRHELFRHEQFLHAQSNQSAACNARHHIPARLATWLLRVSDVSSEDTLLLTQEFLSQMLGVQRASVSLVASELQEAGLIQYRRGTVRIVDRPGLQAVGCECYAAVRMHHQRLFREADAAIA